MRKIPCRACWVDGIASPESYPAICFVEPWKFGSLYRCSNCGCYWFRHENREPLSRIKENLLPLARHWNHNRLSLSPSIWHDLLEIGGIADYYNEQIAITCAVQNSSGQQHECAIVMVSKKPPYSWYDPRTVHWSTEIVRISPSRLALPFSVRQTSVQQEEISMGFAPVGITDDTGQEYILGHTADFLKIKDVKGQSIRLSNYQGPWRNHLLDGICEYGLLIWSIGLIVQKSKDLLTPDKRLPKLPPIVKTIPAEAFYFLDWFDGCEAVILQGDAV